MRRVSSAGNQASSVGLSGPISQEAAYSGQIQPCGNIPPVHVAADHDVGRAVPEVDTGEVTQRVAQLRDTAFCFQAVHQDLGRRRNTWGCVLGEQARTNTFHSASPRNSHTTCSHREEALPPDPFQVMAVEDVPARTKGNVEEKKLQRIPGQGANKLKRDTKNMPSGAIRYPNFLTQKKKHGTQLRATASDYMIGEANKKPAWVICFSPSVFTPQAGKRTNSRGVTEDEACRVNH